MRYRTQTEVSDTLRRIADGTASADPLSASDRAELERIAGHVETDEGMEGCERTYLERVAIAAYSLGARHTLERCSRNHTCDSQDVYDRETINLATGEITTNDTEGTTHEQS